MKKIISFLVCGLVLFSTSSFAKSAREIDASVDTALTRFHQADYRFCAWAEGFDV